MVRKEPDLSNVAKRLTNKRQQCADEIRALMECMAKSGMVESDSACVKQRAAAVLCMQNSAKTDATRAQLSYRIQRIVSLFKRHGFR